MRRGIILAGGAGSRLHPVTMATSKQLVPVFDKPMIFYPLSVVMLSGIKDILMITTPEDQPAFKRLLGNGSQWGVSISYVVQPSPDGLAQAFILGEEYLCGEPSMLVLGDNIFHGQGLISSLRRADSRESGASVFGYQVNDPERYGVVEFDSSGKAVSIEEKPIEPKSNFAVTGLYFYDGKASEYARTIKPSDRGELEITSLNQIYLEDDSLNVELMGRGFAWLDTGTFDTLLQAGEYVRTLQERQGLQIACLEEIAFISGWIDVEQLNEAAERYSKNHYGAYLKKMVSDARRKVASSGQ